jgi:hypothetical protein
VGNGRSLGPAARTTTVLLGLVREGKVKSQSEAARLLGVSRQRIHQIVAREGIGLRFQPNSQALTCRQCGRRLKHPNGRSAVDGLCRYCRGSSKVMVTCPACGKAKEMFRSDYKRVKSDFRRTCAEPERQRRARECTRRYWARRAAESTAGPPGR